MKTYLVLWHIMTYRRWLYLLDTFFWVAINFAWMVQALWAKAFFDKLTGDAPVRLTLNGIITLILVTAALHIFFLVGGMLVDTRFRFLASGFLRRNLLATILKRPGAQAIAVAPGEAISTFRDDADELENTADWLIDVFAQILSAVFALIIMLSINPRITLLTVLPLAVILLVAQTATNRIKRYRYASRQATQRVTGALGEILSAVQAIQIANAEMHVRDHFQRLNDERRHMMVRDRLLTEILRSIFSNSTTLGIGLILVVSAQAMRTGDFTVGDFALFVAYVESLAIFSTFFGNYIAQYKQAGVSFERMVTLLQGEDTSLPPSDSARAIVAQTPIQLTGLLPAIPQSEKASIDRLKQLEVIGLGYQYSQRQYSRVASPPLHDQGTEYTHRGITNVSFSLARGSFTVITGRIGAGKTTLLRALLGLLPAQAGEIRWNGQHVVDPADFFIPPRTAYTSQVPHLFSSTLLENLLLGLNASDHDLSLAIRQAVMEQDIMDMDAGLETVVGPKGVRLSGGQIQRTAAARMFIRRPELLLFDDLSSALDIDTEKTLWERLFASDAAHRTPTCLVVSHRRPALRQADQIIVLKDGRVEDKGKLDELLARCEEMQRLWQGDIGEKETEEATV